MIKRATTCTKHQNRSPPHVCLAASVSKMAEKNTCNSPSSCSKLAIQSRKQIWEPFTHFTTEPEHTKAMEDTTKTGKKRQRIDKANRAAKQFLLTSLRDLCKSSDAAELKKNLGRIASSADKSTIIQTTYFVLSILRKQLEEFWQGLESKQGQKPGRVEETPTDGRTLLSILRRKNPDLGKNGKMPPAISGCSDQLHSTAGESSQELQKKIQWHTAGKEEKENNRSTAGTEENGHAID